MKTTCMIVLISIASCVCITFCYPSKPLNERSTELAWEAWLLVDQSNSQGDSGVLRRKITPKSVFIAPTFSPDSLPPCAEGYKSDSKGRCVKVIKINESLHFEFLLKKLNEQFNDYDEESEETQTPGPFQFNIPLPGNNDDDNETDVAIVVTPSSKTTTVKMDVKRNGNDKFNVENVAAILRLKPEDVEMTTIAELTTMRNYDETTTFDTTTTDGPTTETTTTMDDGDTTPFIEEDAIFYRWRI